MTPPLDEPRSEFRRLVAAFEAHLAWLMQTGAHGLPLGQGAGVRSMPSEATGSSRSTAAHALASVPSAPSNRGSAGEPLRAPAALAALPTSASASSAESLAVLADLVAGCHGCRLCEKRTQTVFARGNGSSGLCFVGEGPGADEDRQGEPFVGAAGQLLDRMIQAMGMVRDEVYVCNIVKCRPPDNRRPEPDEMAACQPFLTRQLELLAPKVMVALGATALQGLLGTAEGILRARGRWKLYRGRIALMPTFHPAYLLRNPNAKRDVWQDLQAVVQHLGRTLPSKS
jgi:uracil-DNA glycosylase family 4